MPSHVYHEVDLAMCPDGRVWVSFGHTDRMINGQVLTIDRWREEFTREFTFDSRYDVRLYEDDEPPAGAPILAVFVSNGGMDRDDHCIYAYELEKPGAYNYPKGGVDSKEGLSLQFPYGLDAEGHGEWCAIQALHYALLVEAMRRYQMTMENELA